MASETNRTTTMRRLTNPSNSSQYVDVKCIDNITFTIPDEQYQDYLYNFANISDNTNRQVHTVEITGSDGSSMLEVERIDILSILNATEQNWEWDHNLIGNAPNTSGPDGSDVPQHMTTFDVTIYHVNTDGTRDTSQWVKIQRVQQLYVNVPVEQYWDKQFNLDWPDMTGDDDMNNPSQLYTGSDGTSINPPWRLDPFQNIVDVHWTSPATFVMIDNGQGCHSDHEEFASGGFTNYDGGVGVYSSPDGINWTRVATLGVVTSSNDNQHQTGYSSGGELTYEINWGTGVPGEPGTYTGYYSPLVGGTPGPIYDGSGTQVGLIVDYGSTSGANLDNIGKVGFASFINSGIGLGLTTFVIGLYYQDTSFNYYPLYYRSTDGNTWSTFVPGWGPTVGWFPQNDDCWFDDGSQRTTTTVSGVTTLDGTPTYLWFSSQGSSGDPLWQSSDGCLTWQSSTYKVGYNPVSSKTDGTYVGNANYDSGLLGSRSTSTQGRVCYGTLASGSRIGVYVSGSQQQVFSGVAGTDPTTWSSYMLPMPANVESLVSIEQAQYTSQLQIPNNTYIDNWVETFTTATPHTGTVGIAAQDPVLGNNFAVASVAAADWESEKYPDQTITPRAFAEYVAFAKTPSGNSIFVVVGNSRNLYSFSTHPDLGSDSVPCIWWSEDGTTWNVATGVSGFDNPWINIPPYSVVAGNILGQTYATVPNL